MDYNNSDFLLLKSKIFYRLGDLDNAIKTINKLLNFNPLLEEAIEFREFLNNF